MRRSAGAIGVIEDEGLVLSVENSEPCSNSS